MNLRWLCGWFTFLFVLALAGLALAQDAPAEEAPQQVETTPEIDEEAMVLLRRMQNTYRRLNSMAVGGEVVGRYHYGGKQRGESAPFIAMFLAPNMFRHQVQSDVQLGSTGEKIFAYSPREQTFLAVDAPSGKFMPGQIPEPVGGIIRDQNPALAMVLSKDPLAELLDVRIRQSKNISIRRMQDVKIEHLEYPTVCLHVNGQPQVTISLDPNTYMVKRIRMDMKSDMTSQGVPDVKEAELTITYQVIEKNPAMTPEDFAWSPPRGTRDANDPEPGEEAQWPAFELAGQPAPDFSLKDSAGNPVTLSDQQGNVVVIDFWATWCAPCIDALPHLDQIQKDFADKGVKVYAIDWDEEIAKVEKFVADKDFGLTVLLDSEGEVGKLYKLLAPPQTMVIGKDGVIRKVFIGPDTHELVRVEVEAALKQQ